MRARLGTRTIKGMRMLLAVALLAGCVGRGRGSDDDLQDRCDAQFEETGDVSQECADAANANSCAYHTGVVSSHIACRGSLSPDEAAELCADLCAGVVVHPCDPADGMSLLGGCGIQGDELREACSSVLAVCE